MENKNQYCQRKEKTDDEYFKMWSEDIFPQWFKSKKRTENIYDRIDYHCITSANTSYNCELKGRDGIATDTPYYPAYFSGIFIEVGKYEYMMDVYNNGGGIPAYWNFFNRGNTVVIFDLRYAKIIRKKWCMVSVGEDGKKEWVERYELDTNTAQAIYNHYPSINHTERINPQTIKTSLYKRKIMKDPYYKWQYENR